MPAKRILLVDDEPDLLKAMRIRLAAWGYDVITASTGEEAVRIVKELKEFLDAVILDIMMPGINGIEALRRIRSFDKKIPVFMLTAYTTEERMEKAASLGSSGFIPKGTEFANASQMIRVALKGTV